MGHPDGWRRKALGAGPIYRQAWFIAGLGAVVVLLIAVVLTAPGSGKAKVLAESTTTVSGGGAGVAGGGAGGTATTSNLAPVPGAAGTLPPTTMPPLTTLPPPTTTTAAPLSSPTTAPPIVTLPPPTTPPTTPTTQGPHTTVPTGLCGAPPNPMGYNLCGRGTLIYHPDPRTCNYFACIANFRGGGGYLIECRDGEYSLAGGRTSECSGHGGVVRWVFSGP